MKIVVALLALMAGCSVSVAAKADDQADRWSAAYTSARWTGPLLASTAETLPQGHFYTEPYLFDSISGGRHNPGSSGFYQYGLAKNFTVGVQPFFSLGTRKYNRNLAIGDFKLLSQLRLSHFTPEHRVPSVALVMNLMVPTASYDNLQQAKEGHGSGAFAPELGVNVQQYFLLGNGHLLRARFNFLRSFPLKTNVAGRSIYQTGEGFRGHARPGSKTTLVGGIEYSVSREWVVAVDVERDQWGRTRLEGRDSNGLIVKQASPKSWDLGVAPAIEYVWSDRAGVIVGLWIVPKGHNTSPSVTPAVAIQRFW